MDYDIANAFKPYLAPGESVRWTGRPKQGVVLRAADAFVIPFSIMWCGFAIFWESAVVAGGAPFFFMLWGVPFVLVGLYMVVGRFFADAFIRSRTRYALTDRSALVLGGLGGDKLTAVDLRTLTELHLKGASGRGTIVFGPDNGFAGAALGWSRRRVLASPEFFQIEDAAGVYSMVQQQRRTA